MRAGEKKPRDCQNLDGREGLQQYWRLGIIIADFLNTHKGDNIEKNNRRE